MSPDIVKGVAALEKMTVGKLHDRYVEVFGETVRSRHRSYLIRRIAWRFKPTPGAGCQTQIARSLLPTGRLV